jgi:alpha-1,3-rhamnosyl/mannosyltransferase
MLRIAFNHTSALRPRTGVGHYAAQLLGTLRELPADLRVTGVPDGWMERLYRLGHRLRDAGPAAPAAAPPAAKSWRHALGEHGKRMYFGHLSRQLTSRRFDVYHEPNFPILPTELPTVLTVHDLSLLMCPEYHPADRIRKFEAQLPKALKQASHIVTVSDFTRSEVIRVLGVPPERVTRTYNGVRPDLKPLPAETVAARLRELSLPTTYLLYVGTLEPRKNLLLLMQAYCRLPSALRERCPLLLVGGWGWNIAPIAEYFESHARHHGVMHLGYVSEEDLAILYNGARALVYPSHYEGFGLPPLEMMACGGPVLASTAGALVEIFGRTAHLMPANDSDGWTRSLARIIEDDAWRAELCRGVREAAAAFTWRRCAEETLHAYQAVLSNPSTQRSAA